MAKLLQVGVSTASELGSRYGHMACTLGGINYESRGGRGCLRGSTARGAGNRLFRHQFHIVLSDAEGAAAKRYADSCVGQPYIIFGVPSARRGGDCSGYASGIICAAKGRPPRRLFDTSTWLKTYAGLGFRAGLGQRFPDRPYPGYVVARGSTAAGHIRWIKGRLNMARHGPALTETDGTFGQKTEEAVRAFQRALRLNADGKVGQATWQALNAVA
ncbi:peptidoglycan-binding domain-containing protein [Actinoplanes sp. NPDC049596]|uniref:peptidoglycan-binding domain-containing protein n=1 Tax=unclassified Actinoplanes TaxID=2626549 RepID=UPI00341ED8C3